MQERDCTKQNNPTDYVAADSVNVSNMQVLLLVLKPLPPFFV